MGQRHPNDHHAVTNLPSEMIGAFGCEFAILGSKDPDCHIPMFPLVRLWEAVQVRTNIPFLTVLKPS